MQKLSVRAMLSVAVVVGACGGDDGGDEVLYGETTAVVVVNPIVNDVNEVTLASPGDERDDVLVESDDGADDVTDAGGVAVLAPLEAGVRTLALGSLTFDASVTVEMQQDALHELAIAADGDSASIMSEVVWPFASDVVEVLPDMTVDEVNAALADSGSVVFFAGGTYTGDLVFAGSNVILFGEGPHGGNVVLDGNVTIEGSGNRMRGAVITGNLEVPGSDAGISFTRVEGQVTVDGSSSVLLYNDFCGQVTIEGSGITSLDNTGLAPLAAVSDCP